MSYFFTGRKYTTNLCVLICRVASLDVSDESEVCWNDLKDTAWKPWSGNNLRKRWARLRETVEDPDDKTHKGSWFRFAEFESVTDDVARNHQSFNGQTQKSSCHEQIHVTQCPPCKLIGSIARSGIKQWAWDSCSSRC